MNREQLITNTKYYSCVGLAKTASCCATIITQIWSVVVCDDDDEPITWTYGPNHHWVNVMGFTATQEHHDGDTYYHECDA